jgi:putative FmdB family regulatory protein
MRHADAAHLGEFWNQMPYYDYVCANCGHEIEVMHSVHADGPTACPKCGGPLKKTFAVPAVHFKGTGWARKEKGTSSRPSRSEPKETAASASSAPPASSSESSSSGSAEPAAAPAAESVSKEPD